MTYILIPDYPEDIRSNISKILVETSDPIEYEQLRHAQGQASQVSETDFNETKIVEFKKGFFKLIDDALTTFNERASHIIARDRSIDQISEYICQISGR